MIGEEASYGAPVWVCPVLVELLPLCRLVKPGRAQDCATPEPRCRPCLFPMGTVGLQVLLPSSLCIGSIAVKLEWVVQALSWGAVATPGLAGLESSILIQSSQVAVDRMLLQISVSGSSYNYSSCWKLTL